MLPLAPTVSALWAGALGVDRLAQGHAPSAGSDAAVKAFRTGDCREQGTPPSS